jgi:hypothetical protein
MDRLNRLIEMASDIKPAVFYGKESSTGSPLVIVLPKFDGRGGGPPS